MRKILLLTYLLGTLCTSWAQGPASWQNLNKLQAGEKIQVLERSSKKVSGTLLNVSDAAVSVKQEAASQEIQRGDVLSVKRMKNKHRLRNALIGAGVGAGVGAVIGGASNNGFFPRGLAAGVVAVVFLVPGAIVGALWPSHEMIYRAVLP